MTETEGLKRLGQLAAKRRKLNEEIDALTESLLRKGEFVADVADALGVSREMLRRFREKHGIPDAREIRAAKGVSYRREGDRGGATGQGIGERAPVRPRAAGDGRDAAVD